MDAITAGLDAILAEDGVLETIGALAWRGYQKQGRGVVAYLPTYGDLQFFAAREYEDMLRDMVSKGNFHGANSANITVDDYDPFSEALFATMLRQPNNKGKWVLVKLRIPKPPQRCKATWRPTPLTDAA